ncbi:flavin reductase [Aureimonas endophytica]|uniref:Flavin reductase n=1 Tax=Aureimonas endophytica TaxID=2027858 RepID=A0A916ZTU9_9HYPH|nr:flavin reductase family protein [Aureimonas endophytica]GGE11287.1 flavin reductase [Aureimonas endophytica]
MSLANASFNAGRLDPSLIGLGDAPRPALKEAMRHLVGGVSVVTAGLGEERTGATVTTAHSLAVDPETMLVSINLSSSSWPVIRRFGHYCVNLLGSHQQAVADRFAGRGGVKGKDRYLGADWTVLETGAGVLVGALASIDCEVEHVVERHSHALIFGAVRAVSVSGGEPLVYSHGRYGAYPLAG